MKTSTIFIIGAGAVSVLIGWFAAGWFKANTITSTPPDASPSGIVASVEGKSDEPDEPVAFDILKNDPTKLDFAAISNLMLRLETAGISDCRRWLERIADNQSPDSSEMKRAIIERFAELDPASALEAVEAHDGLRGYSMNVLGQWAKSDLEGAVDAALAATQQNAIYGVMEGAGSEQIEQLYDLLLERGFHKGTRTSGFFESIFRYLARVDQPMAASLALKFESENNNRHGSALENVLGMWARESPEAALQWVESIEDNGQREKAMAKLAVKWIEQKPLEGLKLVWDRVAFEKQQNTGFSIPGSMKDSEFQDALAWIGEQQSESPVQAAHALQAMISGLWGDNLDRLSQIAPMIEEGIKLDRLRRDIPDTVARWAAQDEAAVLEFIDSTENSTIQEAAIRGLINHWSKNDAARALEFLSGLDEPIKGVDTGALLTNLFEHNDDLDAVFAQIPETMREQSYIDYAWRMSRNAPARALEFFEQQPQGEKRDQAIQHAASYLARENPAAATEWVDSLPEGEDRQYGAANVADSWARFDASAATEWAKSLPTGLSREWALRKIAEVIAPSRPAMAVELALSIQDKETRGRAMQKSLPALARQDPTAALALIDTAEFTETEAKQLATAANESLALRAELAK